MTSCKNAGCKNQCNISSQCKTAVTDTRRGYRDESINAEKKFGGSSVSQQLQRRDSLRKNRMAFVKLFELGNKIIRNQKSKSLFSFLILSFSLTKIIKELVQSKKNIETELKGKTAT